MKTKLSLLCSVLCAVFLFIACGSDSNLIDKPTPEPPINKGEYPKESGDLRIVSYNIRHFENSSGKIDYTGVANLVKALDADVVCFQEVDKNTKRSNKQDQMKEIGQLTQMNTYFSKSIDYQGGEYGNGMLSKEKALRHEKISLPGKEKRSALVVEYDRYVVISTHLSLETYNREESIKILSKEASKYKDKPVYLAGDLNEKNMDTPFLKELKKYWSVDSSNKNTYPTTSATARIDFVLSYKTNNAISKVSGTDVVRKLKGINVASLSDHYPLFCDYTFGK